MNLKQRLLKVTFSDLTAVRWTMGWVSLFLSLGFILATTSNENYNLVNVVDNQIWAAIFLVHGLSLMITALYTMNYYCSKFINLIGIWIWSYVFLSFTVYDTTPLAATEWLLLMPILMEVWMIIEWKK